MLYPCFNDLIALKGRKVNLSQSSRRLVKSTVQGNYHSPFRGQGLEFDSVREYIPGDDIRSIDWRVTARTGSPHLKVFKEDRERQIIICIDMNESMRFGTKKTFKSVLAAKVAAFLGWQGIAHQDRVSVCLFGSVPNGIQTFPPRRTQKSFCQVLKALTEPSIAGDRIELEEVLKHLNQKAHTGSLIYLISDFMNIPNALNQSQLNKVTRKCDFICVAINDPSDQTMYPMGLLGFQSQQSPTIYVNTSNRCGREAYALQWKSNREQLHQITSRLKIPIIELTTESDLRQDLIPALKQIAKRKRT